LRKRRRLVESAARSDQPLFLVLRRALGLLLLVGAEYQLAVDRHGLQQEIEPLAIFVPWAGTPGRTKKSANVSIISIEFSRRATLIARYSLDDRDVCS
jgi:hypothetical protein